VLVLPTGPAIARSELARDVHAALVSFARENGFDRLEIQPRYSPKPAPDDLLAKYAGAGIIEFVLDLAREPEEILMGMHKIHRKNVRRAERSGLTVQADDSLEAMLRLREMQLVASERAEAREHGFRVGDEGWFRRLHAQVYATGPGHVLLARAGNDPVAALAYLKGARRALTVRSGSQPRGYEMRAMYLLHHELIRNLREQGVLELNLGGVPSAATDPAHPQAGLHEFKAGFGGTACLRTGVDVPLREVAP
jgi:GNAT acetyltransferase-like protein